MKFRGGFQLSWPRTPREGFRRSMVFALARVEEMSICAILVTFCSKEKSRTYRHIYIHIQVKPSLLELALSMV